MLYGILVAFYLLVCFLLIPIILIQKSKGSMGIDSLGASTQILFGGSGGQDIFQKTTWILGALFIGGSLFLANMKSKQHYQFNYLSHSAPAQQPEGK